MSQSYRSRGASVKVWCGRSWAGLVDRRGDAFAHARLLSRATEGDANEVVTGFLEFFAATGAGLFRDEEEWIFRSLRPTPRSVLQALEDHIAISSLVRSVVCAARAGSADVGVVRRLGDLLATHLLMEEENVRPLALRAPSALLP